MAPFDAAPGAKKSLKIGITGGIGAGKSTVCKVFQALGVPVYDADSQAKRLLIEDQELMAQIRSSFGEEAYLPDGGLNRQGIAAQVFSNPEKLALLNSLVHPRVGLDFNRWCQQQQAPYVIKEAALLIESGSYQTLDAVIVVTAPQPLRLRRTLMRDTQRSRSQVEEIMLRQLPEAEIAGKAHYKIVNDDNSMVLPQVLRLHRQFLKA